MMRRILSAQALAMMLVLAGCGSDSTSSSASEKATVVTLAEKVAVGEQIFNDASLSASGKLACAGCHLKSNAHADAPGGFLPIGGALLDRQGARSSPSLHYLNANGAFGFDTQGQPFGGFTWDGRADSRAIQARGPLFDAAEMANESEAAVVAKLKAASYYADFRLKFGVAADATDAQVLAAMQSALETYQAGDTDYEPFTSKFDAVLAGTASFSASEARGQAIFRDPQRGNCASCHSDRPDPTTGKILFTNFQYHALGLPRNQSSATQDASFFDLGLCGPKRTDLSNRSDLCGKFKVPTLRNVALTAPYFHNGVIGSLQEAVSFYATRDLDPGRWYPSMNGQVQVFNDLPVQYRGNLFRGVPFGATARLSPQDVTDLVAFLGTLSDGFTP